MRIEDFDFELPADLIALRPARPRDSARLLVIGPEKDRLADRSVRDLPDLLRPDDVLIFNNTRVIPAQLTGTRKRGDAIAKIDLTLHQRVDGGSWRAFARPAKRLRPGETIQFANGLSASIKEKTDGEVLLSFDRSGADLDQAIFTAGIMPLPPYIASKRPVDAADATDYQTVYAREPGAVAAPTAGLHFTQELLHRLREKGISFVELTLHVGAGTFLPVSAEQVEAHRMHAEWGRITEDQARLLSEAKRAGRRLIAVGTTSTRLLESAASEEGVVQPFEGETDIFIRPGYRFWAIDALMTNFHLPRSTLFMLVCALRSRDEMLRAYAHAVAHHYRFYSYGDASLIFREGDL